jgi:hypothetical protein
MDWIIYFTAVRIVVDIMGTLGFVDPPENKGEEMLLQLLDELSLETPIDAFIDWQEKGYLNGHTAEEANEKFQELYAEKIAELKENESFLSPETELQMQICMATVTETAGAFKSFMQFTVQALVAAIIIFSIIVAYKLVRVFI